MIDGTEVYHIIEITEKWYLGLIVAYNLKFNKHFIMKANSILVWHSYLNVSSAFGTFRYSVLSTQLQLVIWILASS